MNRQHRCPTGRHPRPHYSCYCGHGCRCTGCTGEAVAYIDHRRRQRAYGRPCSRLTTPDVARGLISGLLDVGATRPWICEQTGLGTSTLTGVLNGRRQYVQVRTVERLRHLTRQVAAGQRIPPEYADAEHRREQRARKRRQRSVTT